MNLLTQSVAWVPSAIAELLVRNEAIHATEVHDCVITIGRIRIHGIMTDNYSSMWRCKPAINIECYCSLRNSEK